MRGNLKYVAQGAGIAILVLVLTATIVLIIVANTDWGRERARVIAENALNEAVKGEVEIGGIEGNLLRRIHLLDVRIGDDQGQPLIVGERVAARPDLFGLLRQRVILRDVLIENAHILLDKQPDEEWNFVRIFVDPERDPDPEARWGHWIELRDATLIDTHLMVRTAWRPSDELTPAERQEAIRRALAGETRANVVEVASGYQNVMTFTDLAAQLDRVVIAHPRVDGIPIDVDQFAGVVQPFRPPAAVVHDLAGNFLLRDDTLFFDNVAAVLPESRLRGEGAYIMEEGELVIQLEGAPVALNDLRWLYPPLPEDGQGTLRFALDQRGKGTRIFASDVDLSVRDGFIRGRLDLTINDTLVFRDTDVRFADVDSRVVANLIPHWQAPRHGLLTGEAMLDGAAHALRVDADVRFDDFAAPASRVIARGQVAFEDQLAFTDFTLQLDPLRTELLHAFVPEAPPTGTIEGRAHLTGAPGQLVNLEADLTLREPRTGMSRVVAAGGVDLRDELRFRDLHVRADPIQLDLLRPYVSELPAGATATADARLDGYPAGLLRIDGRAEVTDPRTGLSRIRAQGAIDSRGELRLHDMLVVADPLQLDLIRGEVPDLPPGATLVGRARLDGVPTRALRLDADLALNDPASGRSQVAARGAVQIEPDLRFRDLRLDLRPLQLDLLRPEVPDLPAGATVAGPLRLDGRPDGLLHLDGDLTLDDPATGVSQVGLIGGIVIAEPAFRDLDLRFDPLRLALIQHFEPDFPLSGRLDGSATLNGAPDTGIGFVADLRHEEAGELSHVAGRGYLETGRPDGRIDVDLTLQPLSLVTVGRFAPEAGLRGAVAGDLDARGTLSDLHLSASLVLPDTAALVLDGRFDLAADDPAYAFTALLTDVNIAAVTTHAPTQTALTGTIAADGRGLDPETMTATLAADLVGPRIDDLEADEVHLRAAIDTGLLSVDPAMVRLATAEAHLEGSFGLIPERSGVLRYRIDADSLGAFAAYVPLDDTLAVAPSPAGQRRDERAALDARRAAVVEAMATGRPFTDIPPPDTLDAVEVHRGTLAGSLSAEGTIAGNVERFDIDGTVEVENLLIDGNYVESGRARYAVADVGTDQIRGEVVATTSALRVEGFAFDSTAVEIAYSGGRFGQGEATVVAYQDEHTDVATHVAFTLALDRNEIILTDTELRFDDVTWTETQPATIAWGGAGVEVKHLELVSDDGARIFLDGRLPLEGDADMDLEIDRLDIAQILTLLQEDADLSGLLFARARVQGTAETPVMEGEVILTELEYEERPMPDVSATFAFADLMLTAHAEMLDDGRVTVVADAEVPADLSFGGDGPRLLDGALTVDVDAQELPLELVHLFTDDVRIEHGIAAGRIAVRGTTFEPDVQGDLSMAAAGVRVFPLGVNFERARGSFSLEGEQLVIDSLVAWSRGPIRLGGTIDIGTLAEPGFDLVVEAREAWIIDTEDANLLVDADLTVAGPFDGVEVAGDVRVRQGVIYIPELLADDGPEPLDLEDPELFARLDAELIARRDALIQPSPLLENLLVDVRVQIDHDTWLRSTEANIEIYTPPEVGPLAIRLDGFTNGPALEGTVNTERGEYEFMSRRLDVTRGAATFSGDDGFNPFVQLVAEHEVRPPGHEPLRIRLLLTGTVDELDFEIESDAEPPIPQTDLLAYFAFGREAATLLGHQGSTLAGQGATGVGLLGDVTTAALQQLAGVFVDAVIGGFEAETARALGLDVFRVTTTDIPQEILTGRAEDILRTTEFEAGAYVTPRIFIGGQIRPTFAYPGAVFQYQTPGFEWLVTMRPRYLPAEPSLELDEPQRTTTFGSFVRRIWRF